MKLTTYKDIDIHVAEHSGEFSAEVHGNRVDSTSLAGLKSKIDGLAKIKYNRIEAVKFNSTGCERIVLTSVAEGRHFRHKGGVVYDNGSVAYPDEAVLREIDRLTKLKDDAYETLRQYVAKATSEARKVKIEDMTAL